MKFAHGMAGCALLLLASAAAAQPTPGSDPTSNDPRLVWDLTRLFPTDTAWEAERTALAAEIAKLPEQRGSLGRNAAALRTALDRQSAASLRLTRLWVYASTQTSTNNAERRNQERSGLMFGLWGQYSSAVAWVDPEIQALGAAKVASFQAAEPGLQRHAARLRKTLLDAPHTLPPDVEAALASINPVLNSFTSTRSLLVNADIDWPTLTIDGVTVRISDTG
ncbi:MAG: hypothetical protein LH480_11585 [Rubrivivax sp.]|nr:hypothetical protein [Rubrivivax sp.]